jgi:hypothetical protein
VSSSSGARPSTQYNTGYSRRSKSPVIPDGGSVRETTLTTDRANENLDYLEKYEYTTVEHVTWLVLVETGMRMGGAHELDVDDYRREEEQPHLQLLHRPDTDTPLKTDERESDRSASLPMHVISSTTTSRTDGPV